MEYTEILLDMQNRIIRLEKEVELLKKQVAQNNALTQQMNISAPETGKRDTTRYMFNGGVFPKNRLVLAVVQEYVRRHTFLTCSQLKQVFEKSLQGSIGVVETVQIARLRPDYEVRFFTREQEVLHLSDGDMYVCTQWGILNIPNFIKRAEQLGFQIDSIG
ncbi:MAG TPA: hypothetical protein H9729_02415 [Candidatus Borkfalkia excrementigallinarum]|uniref:Uncharacterized protein n=1 Tax=Candidatus Borkfalkia excrementigallinarum TaxID=2838506 RepID=A0A9D1ZYW0_9FIRM|nr:hypothetical protein [Candidatus Borkfalkia excrementigallinarum]